MQFLRKRKRQSDQSPFVDKRIQLTLDSYENSHTSDTGFVSYADNGSISLHDVTVDFDDTAYVTNVLRTQDCIKGSLGSPDSADVVNGFEVDISVVNRDHTSVTVNNVLSSFIG